MIQPCHLFASNLLSKKGFFLLISKLSLFWKLVLSLGEMDSLSCLWLKVSLDPHSECLIFLSVEFDSFSLASVKFPTGMLSPACRLLAAPEQLWFQPSGWLGTKMVPIPELLEPNGQTLVPWLKEPSVVRRTLYHAAYGCRTYIEEACQCEFDLWECRIYGWIDHIMLDCCMAKPSNSFSSECRLAQLANTVLHRNNPMIFLLPPCELYMA